MGILGTGETNNIVRTPTASDIDDAVLHGSSTDIHNVTQYVEGMPYEVTYFSRISDKDTELTMPDISIPPAVQQYNRIDKLIIKLQGGLPVELSDGSMTGEAIINSGFIPQRYDPFFMQMLNGKVGIFVITLSTKRVYNARNIYHVEFALHAFKDVDPNVYNDIVNKTARNYTYDKDYVKNNSAPIILHKQYTDKKYLDVSYYKVLDNYLNMFKDTSTNLLRLPTTSYVYSDLLLANFLHKIVDNVDNNKLDSMVRVDDSRNEGMYTIWDAVLFKDTRILSTCIRDVGYVRTSSMAGYESRTPYHLGIDYTTGDITGTTPPNYTVVGDVRPRNTTTYPSIRGSSVNKYILTDDFYNGNLSNLGDFERLVYNYVSNVEFSTTELITIIGDHIYWDIEDQYTLVPLLLLLIKTKYHNTYREI